MAKKYLQKVQESGQTVNPLFNFLGINVEMISPEKVVLALPLRDEFIQGAGVIAGGVMAALADEAMAHITLANLKEAETTATIEMNMRYLKSIRKGALRAEATLVKKGRRVVTVKAEVSDDTGELLAQSGASFMVIEKKE
jgi:uncharacterized protein (TIGR00369 family)